MEDINASKMHWMAIRIPDSIKKLDQNASQNSMDQKALQNTNKFSMQIKNDENNYTYMGPKDVSHTYKITIHALNLDTSGSGYGIHKDSQKSDVLSMIKSNTLNSSSIKFKIQN